MTFYEALINATRRDHLPLLHRKAWGCYYSLSLDRKFHGCDEYETYLFVFIPGRSVKVPWVATTPDILADDWEFCP